MSASLEGSFRVLVLYDVAEEIDLESLRKTLGTQPSREPAFRHPAPGYVRFERPPVVETLEPILLETGERLAGHIRYFDYGVISVHLELKFAAEWNELVRLSSRWISAPEIERVALERVKSCVGRARGALVKPYSDDWISEDYYIIQIDPCALTAEEMLSAHGDSITQIVRGESVPLSPGERAEVLQSSMSYYPSDLLVAGWVAAFVYDTAEAAAPTIQLLEYANTQLLEFRHYDEVLTHVLAAVYKSLERKSGLWARWRLAGEAERLNTIRLDITELAERTDNAIKFLSDMFYARAYRQAAGKIGVTDYRNLVEEKLKTAGELYNSMVNEFHQARGFVLETLVVIILLIEIVFLFRGKV